MSAGKSIKRALKYILHGIPTNYTTAQIVYSTPSSSLKEKKIIITGGGRGLGYAMAKKFLAEGAEVLIAGRNEKHWKRVLKNLDVITSYKMLAMQLVSRHL